MTKTVLIIDDDPIIRRLIAAAVSRSGFSSVPCESAHEALDLVKHTSVDLITLDMMMPDMSGTDFLKTLEHSEPNDHIPVLVISALESIPELMDMDIKGKITFLKKPFTIAALQNMIIKSFGE